MVILAQSAESAVTITVTPDGASKAVFSFDGSLTLRDFTAFTGGSNTYLHVISQDGFVSSLGQFERTGMTVGSSPFKIRSIAAGANAGAGSSVLSVNTTDTSDANTLLYSGSFDSILFDPLFFVINSASQQILFGSEVDAGDIMTFSGSFDHNLGAISYENTFNVGTYTGAYNGEALTFVVSPVPEPSSALLLGIGSLGLLVRRKRG